MKKIYIRYQFYALTTVVLFTACSESYLDPKSPSLQSPGIVFSDEAGYEGMLTTCRQRLKWEYYGDNKGNASEFMFSDLAVNGNPESDRPHNLDIQITPTGVGESQVRGFWNEFYKSINYANIVITHINDIQWSSTDNQNTVLAEGYFHRAYYYYRLVHQYGDVPWIGQEINTPHLDFTTYSRDAILNKISKDLEFSIMYLPETAEPGKVSRAAVNFLLAKVYLSLRQFDKAIAEAGKVLGNTTQYDLMRTRFGEGRYSDDPEFNVVWDLHQRENKSIPANKEGILVVQDKYGFEGCTNGTWASRDFGPAYWWGNKVTTPEGKPGTTDVGVWADSVQRSLGRVRPSEHHTTTIWHNANNDLRHCEANWFDLDDFVYNNPDAGEEYYMQKVPVEQIQKMGLDTIRTVFAFPFYKINIPDELRAIRKPGGNSDWYVYRVAELYLLRAEAYWWKGDLASAAADINRVRARALADPIQAGDVTIDYIFDERARELYAEEPRKTEMTRVAYIMAQLNKDGYTLDNMHQKNWYYDRVIRCNCFYRENILHETNIYKMSPFHVYWPINADEISGNALGIINQNLGYPGDDKRVEPIHTIE
jgi:hypothetical protein